MENDKSWKDEAHHKNREYFLEGIQKQKKINETFTYKGYHGTAKIDVNDACLYGKVLYTRNLIMYASDTVQGLRAAFEDSVDCYIEHLESINHDEVTNSYNKCIDNFTE